MDVMTGFTRDPGVKQETNQPVAIIGVDPAKHTATGLTRIRTEIPIDTSYAVGETFVTPAVGEQWYVHRVDGFWRLATRIPFNDESLLIEPVEGQTSLGSPRGPIELTGTVINAHAPVTLPAYPTAKRPDPAQFKGGQIYDSTLKAVVHSDGTAWVQPGAEAGLSSTDELDEGETNLYFTAERAVDALADALAEKADLVARVSSGTRPSAASVEVGTQIYDTTVTKPLWSDGLNWRDAAGTIV